MCLHVMICTCMLLHAVICLHLMLLHVVTCSDTVTRSALLCAIATTIERCKTEGVVDIFQVVKALRVHRPGAIRSVVSIRVTVDVCDDHYPITQLYVFFVSKLISESANFVYCFQAKLLYSSGLYSQFVSVTTITNFYFSHFPIGAIQADI